MTQRSLTPHQALARIEAHLQTLPTLKTTPAAPAPRLLVGVVGKPGVGKSTFSQFLLERLPAPQVAVVPMDGYHLSNAVLQSLQRAERKGAPDTFDVAGFASLLQRMRSERQQPVYYPVFDRAQEESIAAQGIVTPDTQVVIVEGNYLLHDADGWEVIHPLLDECWMLELNDATRLARLIARHVAFGKSPQAAHAWATGSDEANAQRIALGAARADFVVQCDEL